MRWLNTDKINHRPASKDTFGWGHSLRGALRLSQYPAKVRLKGDIPIMVHLGWASIG